ncbi:MAG: methyltransferase domain-containing protein [Candidatus Dormibacteraeota bacterium]|nr:methyltransferase domain-containing protein [Candidatus Dormibacteraeota bacterium]
MIESEVDPRAVARAQQLLDHFLANRTDRTLQAYSIDIEEFARFLALTPATAIARLLASGPSAARRVVLEYAVALRWKGRAQATIDRRLCTLRALVRTAQQLGLVGWVVEVLAEDLVSAAMEVSQPVDSEHYFFPRNPSEIDRLDVQHYALREAVGANYLAPVGEPSRVLDVGCGTGQWGFEVCQQLPEALVVGFDLVSGKLGWPPRYRLVKGNLLKGLPFADDQFDFVHQRLLVSGVPVAAWPSVVADLVRVTKPGGWLELVEPPLGFDQAGQATQRLFALWKDLTASLELETESEVSDALDRYLREAALEGVVRREIRVPVGEWGGQAGALMATDFRVTSTRVCEMLQAQSRLSAEEAGELIRAAQQEVEQSQMYWTLAIAFGQKPD